MISFQRDIFIVFFSSGGFKRAAVAAIVWDSGGRRISIGVRYFATEMTDDGVAPVSSGVHRSANRISSAISHSSRRRLHAFFFFFTMTVSFFISFSFDSSRPVKRFPNRTTSSETVGFKKRTEKNAVLTQ